ncbi:ornithine decarboxylase 2-like [Mizuhopecten yessoensis]|uniref:ornithine decarboxylase 2-like n=1 Tax=Mizuhopecten yessoensis TaxID=6573 RepID=UPI000B457642|nr:ornithine decarboxylase 2-like [Mizuhopecten yessoensis]
MNKTLFPDNNVSRIKGDTDVRIVDVRCSHVVYIKRQVTFQAKLGIDDPLLIVDIDEVVERYRKWYKLFPRVELYYGLKCNNDDKIVDVLMRLGSSFDCASKVRTFSSHILQTSN